MGSGGVHGGIPGGGGKVTGFFSTPALHRWWKFAPFVRPPRESTGGTPLDGYGPAA